MTLGLIPKPSFSLHWDQSQLWTVHDIGIDPKVPFSDRWDWSQCDIWTVPSHVAIPWCRSQFTAILPFCQLICTAAQLICTVEQLIWPHHLICHKKITLIDASHAVSKLILAHKIYQTIPNHTKPNLMTWNFEEASQIKFQVTFDSSYMLICGPKYHFLFKFGPRIWKMSKKYMF